MQQSPMPAHFKIIFLGDCGVGKTTFANRYISPEYQYNQTAPQGYAIHSLIVNTNLGPIKVDLWDPNGHQKQNTLNESYYIGSDAAILMFDVSSRITYQNIPKWYKEVTKTTENLPMVLVGNKVDQKTRQVKPKEITFHRIHNLQYYDVSAKANYHVEKTLLWLLRKLVGSAQLQFAETLKVRPSEALIDKEYSQKMEEELKQAQHNPIMQYKGQL